MSPDTTETSVPAWTAQLLVSVARIESRTEQIPRLQADLEALRANSVPLSEHIHLMKRVDTLWDGRNRVIGALSFLGVFQLALSVYVLVRAVH